jgi:hypothetical protein
VAALTPTLVDLFLQISVLTLLVVSMLLAHKKKMKLHGNMMIAAVALNIISFVAVMGPAWDNVGEGGSGSIGPIAMAHVTTGGLAFLLSIWLAGSWILSTTILQAATPSFMRCYSQKIPMWITLLLWTTSLFLGIVLYLIVNTTLLGSFSIGFGN